MVTREERDRGECLGRILNGQPTLSVSDPPAKTDADADDSGDADYADDGADDHNHHLVSLIFQQKTMLMLMILMMMMLILMMLMPTIYCLCLSSN